MPRQSGPYYANQRDIRMRHDAHLWIRHDVKRFFKPGTDLADVVPALRRRRDAEEAAFAAEIAKGYRLLAVLREEVASIKADLVRGGWPSKPNTARPSRACRPALRAVGSGPAETRAEAALEALAVSVAGTAQKEGWRRWWRRDRGHAARISGRR
jgi:hypothetical protein